MNNSVAGCSRAAYDSYAMFGKAREMSEETVISAFSADHVARITGLTPRQLSYWDNIGFFKPAYAQIGGGARSTKIYSFKDVVGLRVIAVLLNEHRISLRQLQTVAGKLLAYTTTPWSTLKLMVCSGEVSFIDPSTGSAQGVLSGQYILVPVIDEIRHVQRAASNLSHRSAEQIGSVERHRNVAHNARVFSGTRIPTRAVERFLAAGYSVDAILDEYPSLQRGDIEAVKEARNKQTAA